MIKTLTLKLFRPLGILLCLWLLFSCSSTKNLEKHFSENPAFHQGFSGLMVWDPEERKVLFQKDAEKYFTPASNIKLFTFYTGLVVLGDSVPALKYAIKNDSLIFSPTGDPSFLNPDLAASKVYDFLKESERDLYYVVPEFEEKPFGPGWAWDDFNSYYSVERSAFPLYGNRASFEFSPGSVTPRVHPPLFKDSVEISSQVSRNASVRRNISKNLFSYLPGEGMKEHKQNVPFKVSSELSAKILSDTLGREVRLLEDYSLKNSRTLYSIPTDSIYKRMMEESDNFIAEQILLLSAQTLTDTLKSGASIEYMKKTHLIDLPDEPYWVDGSGLSRYNLVTPRTMVSLLEKIYRTVPQERLFNLLATGGKSGTLRNSYKAEEPYIFAKTGTLRNNHSLSGFLRAKSGKILIFSFMNSNYTVPTPELRKQMEFVLRDFYERN